MIAVPVQPITNRQLEVLMTIINSTVNQGYPPSIRELMEALDVKSTNGIRQHLRALQKRGWIQINHGSSRGIVPVSPQVRAAICTGMLNDLCFEVPGIIHFVEAIQEEFTQVFDNQVCY
jgi:SOS-response transcriptional repressor LexA